LIVAAALAAGVAAGCGSDDSSSSTTAAETSTATESTSSTTQSTVTTTDSGSDLDAIEATVEGWILEGGCERMTDDFLEEQTFDDNPRSACETFEASFAPPAYDADDFETDVTYEDDEAEAEVSSPGIDVTSVYHLVKEGDTWKIDSADIK